MTERRYVHVLGAWIGPAWRGQAGDALPFGGGVLRRSQGPIGVTTFTYSTISLKAGVDVLVWSISMSLDALEDMGDAVLRSGMGSWMEVRQSFLRIIKPSPTSSGRRPRTNRSCAAPRAAGRRFATSSSSGGTTGRSAR